MEKIIASLITIGDELLIGQTLNTNAAWIGRELNKAGIWLAHSETIGDVPEAIVEALDIEGKRSHIVLMTGGLGPTNDDLTKKTLNSYFDSRLILDEDVLAQVKKRIAFFGGDLLESNRAQALVPDKSIALFNALGTAPGLWFEKKDRIYVSLPGVPHEMKGLMSQEVIPRLIQHFDRPAISHRTLITTGVPESVMAKRLEKFEEELPAYVKLAYLPGGGMLKLRLTGVGSQLQALQRELENYDRRLEELVKEDLVATSDTTLSAVIGTLLKERQWTVGTAESCTGGYISHLFTSVSGSSNYYQGSFITYSNYLKNKLLSVPNEVLKEKGAVSEEVVTAMLEGLIDAAEVDVGVTVSGIMGPCGGSEEKPVGTVWMAAGSKDNYLTKKLQLRYDRELNIQLTANYALLLLLKVLKTKEKL